MVGILAIEHVRTGESSVVSGAVTSQEADLQLVATSEYVQDLECPTVAPLLAAGAVDVHDCVVSLAMILNREVPHTGQGHDLNRIKTDSAPQ